MLTGAVYFSDCQAGAAAGCVPGDNANAGTSAASPKQNLAGFDVNALPAGTQLLFARGGAWINFTVALDNLNATATSPLVFDSYAPSWGGTAPPWIKGGFGFGRFNTSNDGGYVIRNLKIDGLGSSNAGFYLHDTHDVTLENLEITGFRDAIVNSNGTPGTPTIRSLSIRNNNIHHNSEHGILGGATDLLVEGNTFANNDPSGRHSVVLLNNQGRGVVRGNTFANNSTVNGECTGGNLMVHGQWDGLLIEGNTVTHEGTVGMACGGISARVTSGSNSVEYFRNLVVRGNTLANLGYCAICLSSAPGALIENNLIVNTQPLSRGAIVVPQWERGAEDDPDANAIIRNNTIYFSQAPAATEAIRVGIPTSNMQVVSNLIFFGAASNPTHSCFSYAVLGAFAAFANNLCHHAGGGGTWSSNYGTLAAAQAAGFDTNGKSDDPMFEAVPASANGWNAQVQAASPAVNAGHPLSSSPKDRVCQNRMLPDIGAFER